ncbi:MAG: tetratricopeptide repeat protein [Nannocystales bacterium]
MDGADSVLDMAVQFAGDGESSDAEALIRFALSTDPESARAHLILAHLRARRGELADGVDELIASARRLATAPVEDPCHLYAMFGGALELAPERLELHVDLARLQAAFDDVPGALARLVQLSAIYVEAGCHDDARDVLAVASAWDPQSSVAGVIETELPIEESIPILLEEVEEDDVPQPVPSPVRRPRVATICTPTLLRGADGSMLPNQDAVPAPAQSRRGRPTRTSTICTPTLMRDAQGRLVPNQAGIPKPATERSRPAPTRPRVPAPPTDRPCQRSGKNRRTSIRTLRARAQVRKQADVSMREASLANRLRKLGGLPSTEPRT